MVKVVVPNKHLTNDGRPKCKVCHQPVDNYEEYDFKKYRCLDCKAELAEIKRQQLQGLYEQFLKRQKKYEHDRPSEGQAKCYECGACKPIYSINSHGVCPQCQIVKNELMFAKDDEITKFKKKKLRKARRT